MIIHFQIIVKNLTGRDVPVILDPTMIITRKQWDENIPDNIVVNLNESSYNKEDTKNDDDGSDDWDDDSDW